eukprot:gene22576-163_t
MNPVGDSMFVIILSQDIGIFLLWLRHIKKMPVHILQAVYLTASLVVRFVLVTLRTLSLRIGRAQWQWVRENGEKVRMVSDHTAFGCIDDVLLVYCNEDSMQGSLLLLTLLLCLSSLSFSQGKKLETLVERSSDEERDLAKKQADRLARLQKAKGKRKGSGKRKQVKKEEVEVNDVEQNKELPKVWNKCGNDVEEVEQKDVEQMEGGEIQQTRVVSNEHAKTKGDGPQGKKGMHNEQSKANQKENAKENANPSNPMQRGPAVQVLYPFVAPSLYKYSTWTAGPLTRATGGTTTQFSTTVDRTAAVRWPLERVEEKNVKNLNGKTFDPMQPPKDIPSDVEYHQYIIIGAGPGGLQMAYYMQKASMDYLVLERDEIGAFFLKYPRHRQLISINKGNTGSEDKDFSMRHDWNSLLTHDFHGKSFPEYSKDYFPPADTYLEYLSDFARDHKLNIREKSDVKHLHKVGGYFEIELAEKKYIAGVVLLATGKDVPNKPKPAGGEHLVTGYEEFKVNPELYTDQEVLIVGAGNSAFETADALSGTAAFTHVAYRGEKVPLAYHSHYVGDVRAVNLGGVDRYQLKSLDAFLPYSKYEDMIFVRNRTSKRIMVEPVNAKELDLEDWPSRRGYHHVIRCLGFKWNSTIFDSELPRQ